MTEENESEAMWIFFAFVENGDKSYINVVNRCRHLSEIKCHENLGDYNQLIVTFMP